MWNTRCRLRPLLLFLQFSTGYATPFLLFELSISHVVLVNCFFLLFLAIGSRGSSSESLSSILSCSVMSTSLSLHSCAISDVVSFLARQRLSSASAFS